MAEHTPGPNTNALIVAAGVAEQENERLRAINADLLAALAFIVSDTLEPGEDARLTVAGYNRACAAIAKARGTA